MPTTTLDSFRKVNHTLSGGSLVATSTGAGGVGTTRFVQGNVYAEFTITTLTGTPAVGFAGTSASLQSSPEALLYALGYDPTGAVKVNNVTLATIAAWVQGNRIDMALNPTQKLVWFRVAGGNWNNNAANDPATNTGGIDYSAAITVLETLQLQVYASLTGNVWTCAFSAASFAGAAPAGYSSMDVIVGTVTNNTPDDRIPPLVAADVLGGSNAIVKAMPHPNDRIQRLFTPAGPIQTVSGTVQEYGVAVAGRRVIVYDRVTGEMLGTTVSAVDGTWSINCLGRVSVRVVCSDPFTFDSMVFDNVVPM